MSAWIVWEAIRRFDDPPEILGGWMLVVALVGLMVNAIAATILLRSGRESLNVDAAFRHVLADLLGSAGVLVAALVIVLTGWERVDPIVSILIAVLIVASAWTILRDSTAILMEETPSGIDADEVARAIVEVDGVSSVHDLHVWRITSGFDALSAHVLVGQGEDCHARRRDVERMIAERFGITHDLQVDHDAADALIAGRREAAPHRSIWTRRGGIRRSAFGGWTSSAGGSSVDSPFSGLARRRAAASASPSPSAGRPRRSRSARRSAPCTARS